MTPCSASPRAAALAIDRRAASDGWRRAFRGLDRHVVALVAALCAVWTVSMTFRNVVGSWNDGTILRYLCIEVGATFAGSLLTAAVMGLPLLAIGNLGPQEGWRRMLALALGILAVTPAAVALRVVTYALIDDSRPDFAPGPWVIVFSLRYAQQAALLTLMAEFHRRTLRNEQAVNEADIDRLALDREVAEARLQAMQAQIEPHFLFNTLANVRRLLQTDLGRGRRMLANLMRYLEVALPRMRAAQSSVDRELALVEAYLGVQAVRMGDRLRYAIDASPELRSLPLPPMMLLTLVENAIKHGLNPLPKGGRIRITVRRVGDRLRVEVADDGRGFHASAGAGTGLANIQARLAALHAGASVSLVQNAGRGVTSALDMPAAYPAPAEAS